jgi:ABC-2 type transport system permease protein
VRTVLTIALVRGRGRLVSLTLGIGTFLFLVGLSFAAVDQNTIRDLYESLPPALKALSGESNIASPTGYLGSTYVHPVPLVIQGAVAISFATAPARDLESGFAELILSRRISRRRWLGSHAIATATGLVLVALGGLVGGLIASATVADLGPVSARGLLAASLGGLLLFLAFAGIALICAAVAPSAARAVGFAAGVAVAMYALNYLGQVWTVMEPFRPLSLFSYYDPGVIVTDQALPAGDAAVMAGVAVVATIIALVVIGRREITS